MRLALIHRPRGIQLPPVLGTTWSTCIREVTFIDAPACDWPSDADLLTDEQAYAVLLEIVCGVRSPVIGETEVQAQFKTFLNSIDPILHGPLRRLGERVLSDAKRIRHLHLQGVGAHSYGRLALRYVTTDSVAIVGAGALARDVVSHLHREMHADLWSRRLDGDAFRPVCQLDRHLLDEALRGEVRRTGPTSVVIASPVSESTLNSLLACYANVAEVVDLRAADESTPITRPIPHITLATLLADAESAESSGAASVIAARRDIETRARAFASREVLHPAGWDDICA